MSQKQYIHLVAELAPGFTPVTTTMDLPIDAELNRTTSISNSNDITPNITPIPTRAMSIELCPLQCSGHTHPSTTCRFKFYES